MCAYRLSGCASNARNNSETRRQVNAHQLVSSIPFRPVLDDTRDKITVSYSNAIHLGKCQGEEREMERKRMNQ